MIRNLVGRKRLGVHRHIVDISGQPIGVGPGIAADHEAAAIGLRSQSAAKSGLSDALAVDVNDQGRAIIGRG